MNVNNSIKTPPQKRLHAKKKPKWSILQAVIVGSLSSCFIGVLCVGFILLFDNGQLVFPTSMPEMQIPIEQVIAMTANEAQMQTQVFYAPINFTPTILLINEGTITFTPTVTLIPNKFLSVYQTNVALTPAIPPVYASPMFPPLPAYAAPTSPAYYAPPSSGSGCCKVCTTGKPCGDSCISVTYTCHEPPGCAC